MKKLLCAFTLFFAVCSSSPAQTSGVSYTINTVAGSEVFSETGRALDTWLDQPEGLAVDDLGNVYVADTLRNRIIRVSPEGTLELPDTEAPFFSPRGIAFGPDGGLYVAQSSLAQIQRIVPDGSFSTVAGSGTHGFGGDNGPATEASLRFPSGVAVAADGTTYIADAGNNRIRKVDPDGTITTVAGDGTRGSTGDGGPAVEASLSNPRQIALGPEGNLYIADSGNSLVRRVDAGGIITSFVGSTFRQPPPTVAVASFSTPSALAFDGAGDLYVTEEFGSRVIVIRSSDLSVETFAGTGESGFGGDGGAANEARLNMPRGIAVGGNTVYIADTQNHRVREVVNGNIRTIAGRAHLSGDGGPATAATLDGPRGVGLDAAGNFYIADTGNSVVRRVGTNGVISTVAGTGDRGFSGDGGPALSAQLFRPVSVAAGQDGSLFISDSNNRRVRKVDGTGTITTFAGDGDIDEGEDEVPATQVGLTIPEGLAVDATGNLLIVDSFTGRTRSVSADGVISTIAGTGNRGFNGDGRPALETDFNFPGCLAIDSQHRLYISDSSNNRVRTINLDGTVETVVGGGEELLTDGVPALEVGIFFPDGLTFDQDGNLIVAVGSRSRIYRLEPDGILTQIAGTTNDFGGDGGPAREASLSFPQALASDPDGNIYVADRDNNRVRKLTPVVIRINTGGVVNAASIAFSFAVDTVAPNSIVSIFGIGLSFVSASASSLPLPTELRGVRVEITDSEGLTTAVPLFAVTPNQVNCLIPDGTAIGPATLTVHSGGGRSTIEIDVVRLAPGLFAINAGGQGVAVAFAFRRDVNLVDTPLPVFDTSRFPFEAVPIDLGAETDIAVLSLFGTGIRGFQDKIEVTIGGEPAQIFGFAPSPEFEGLDQLNVGLSRSLIGRGEVEIRVVVDGIPLNVVTVTVL